MRISFYLQFARIKRCNADCLHCVELKKTSIGVEHHQRTIVSEAWSGESRRSVMYDAGGSIILSCVWSMCPVIRPYGRWKREEDTYDDAGDRSNLR